jgi:hypothetical protein
MKEEIKNGSKEINESIPLELCSGTFWEPLLIIHSKRIGWDVLKGRINPPPKNM